MCCLNYYKFSSFEIKKKSPTPTLCTCVSMRCSEPLVQPSSWVFICLWVFVC